MGNVNNFFFTRLEYESGDWDVDQRMPANLLNSLIEYTTLPVDTQENIIPLSSSEIFHCPFCYLSGHKLVEFTHQEKKILKSMYAMVVLSLLTIAIMISTDFLRNHSKHRWNVSFRLNRKNEDVENVMHGNWLRFLRKAWV